jgi:cytochrome c oxidase subunit 2
MQSALLWLCIASASVVLGFMLYSVAAYRSPTGGATSHRLGQSLIGIVWAAVPIIIIVAAALPTVRSLMLPGEPQSAAQVCTERPPLVCQH